MPNRQIKFRGEDLRAVKTQAPAALGRVKTTSKLTPHKGAKELARAAARKGL